MFPLSHTYVSTKATGKETALLIFGSILPDVSTTSQQRIGRDSIHNAPKEFNDFICSKYPQLKDLGVGVRLHSQVGSGADFYSDDPEVGYAMVEGKKLVSDVSNLLKISSEDIKSLVLAHNFIELSVDLHLYNSHRELWGLYKTSLENVQADFPQIALCIGQYLDLDQSFVLQELHGLIGFLSADNLISKSVAVEKIVLPLVKLRFSKDVSNEETLKILDKALFITNLSYMAFLNNAVKGVKENIVKK